jgi:hypothetical protein
MNKACLARGFLMIAVSLSPLACSKKKSSPVDGGTDSGSSTSTGGKSGSGTGGKGTGGSGTAGKGTGGSGTSGAGGKAGGGAGAAGTASGGTGGSGGAPSCTDYCTAIMKNCTGGDGSSNGGNPDATKTHQQYSAVENCMAACTAFPVGTLADTSGNTLGCRLYHANAAASDATLHCPHAGPGGDGTCGSACDGYCQLVDKFCVGAAKIYADDAACHARCAATTDDIRFNVGTQEGDHVACLLYHAQESPLAPMDHCSGDLAEEDGGPASGSVTCK